tara:strand:+ start:574 stop:1350 length:777 start_codon:yes stop_codon:yes gene_type:complete
MKITKSELRRIIREAKKGLWANIHAKKKRGEKSNPRTKAYQDAKKAGQKINKEEDEKLSEMLGHDTMAYEADERARDELATQIRHASKDIYGTKDHYDLRGKSMEELEDILYDLANSPEQKYMDDSYRDEMEDEMGRDQDLSRAEMAPRRQGMSRRPGGSKSQRRMESKSKITKRQLKKIIREEKARLLSEMNPADMSMHDAADYYERTASPEIRKAVAELLNMRGRPTLRQGSADDEIYIMTGAAEGITVKVLRRGT